MSGAQTSTFADPNILYKTLSGAGMQEVEANRLMNVERQQTIAANNTEVVARAASTLLDPTLYPTEEARAAAWPGVIKQLKAGGYAPNAPDDYPGEQHLRLTARLGTPSADLFKLQQNQAGWGQITGDGTGTTSTGGGGGGGTAATGGVAANAGALRDQLVSTLGVSPVDAGAILSNFHAESGLKAGVNEIHPVIPGSRGGYGLAQWTGPRRDALEAFAQQNKLDVSQPATQLAFMKQELQRPEYAGVLQAMKAAQTPEEKAAIFFHGYLSGNAPSLEHNLPGHVARASAYVGLPAATTAATQPQGPPGAATAPATPAPYRVASNAPTPPPTSTAPADGDLMGPRPLPPIGPGSPVVTPQSLANTPTPQPQAQVPQAPPNRVMPGSADGPPQPAAPVVAQQQPPAPVAARPAAPAAGGMLAGLSPDQVQELRALQRSGATPAAGLAMINHFREVNASAAHQTLEEQQAAERLQMSRGTAQREQEAAAALAEQRRVENARAEDAAKREAAKAVDLILDSGDDGSARYARAYSQKAAPITHPDGSVVYPNMTAYDYPTYRGGKGQVADAEAGAPDYETRRTTPPTIMNATQSQAAGFADRVRDALPTISDTSDAAMSRWQILLGKAPLGNSWVSPEFQQHMQAERNFINATLRKESGMAISESEFVNARQQYIPQPGDKPPVLADKAKNRAEILKTLTREAGPAYKPAPPASTAEPANKPLKDTKVKVDLNGDIVR